MCTTAANCFDQLRQILESVVHLIWSPKHYCIATCKSFVYPSGIIYQVSATPCYVICVKGWCERRSARHKWLEWVDEHERAYLQRWPFIKKKVPQSSKSRRKSFWISIPCRPGFRRILLHGFWFYRISGNSQVLKFHNNSIRYWWT